MEEKLYFNNNAGLRLCGILSKPDVPTPRCVVMAHGLTGAGKEGEIFGETARELVGQGLASFRFDFRGHGESEGRPDDITLTGEKKDFESVFEFLKSGDFHDFAIVAASFAAGPALSFLRENPGAAKVAVLLNPVLEYNWLFTSNALWPKANFGHEAMMKLQKQGWAEIGKFKLKIGRQFVDEMRWMQPLQAAANISLPLLFLHGDRDSTVPFEYSVRYSKLFQGSRFKIIAGADHGFHDNQQAAEEVCHTAIEFITANFSA